MSDYMKKYLRGVVASLWDNALMLLAATALLFQMPLTFLVLLLIAFYERLTQIRDACRGAVVEEVSDVRIQIDPKQLMGRMQKEEHF